ncbi:hypothetical protein ACH3XW_44595 [Acanthocheilonema viteae]
MRPLTYDDSIILRPIDFILPNASLFIPNGNNDNEDEFTLHKPTTQERLLKHWSSTLETLNVFWEIWKDQYLNSLKDRHQLEHKSPRNVAKREPIGKVVLSDEHHAPRGTWKSARIKKLNVANDGYVRSPQTETPSGKLLSRPVNMLYPFEVSPEEQSIQGTP